MRLLFKEGKQRKLIREEKEKLNLSWNQFAKHLNIKIGKLLACYHKGNLLDSKLFDKFLLKEKFSKYITEKKEENWGKSKGGRLSQGNTKEIKIPAESVDLAEFYGIMLGDGNLTVKKGYKIGSYQIRIVGDSRHDKEYLNVYVKDLIENLFDIKAKISKISNRNVLNLVSTGRKLAEFLESKGFKPGNKIKNQLEIPLWIKSNKSYLRYCLRGLYDTDGSAYKLTNQNSYQICFTNYNLKLMTDVRNSLLELGINPSQITKGRDIVITKKSELRKFLNEVGFRNLRHLNKIKMWNLAP